ncbi:MAG: hypothetical protein KGO53_08045 [Alphaproteobacteria bacterium]|nr:hypothetical protein [Alphaproteobacteria bacterium]
MTTISKSKLFKSSTQLLIAAVISASTLASSAFAGNSAFLNSINSSSRAAAAFSSCPPPKSWVKVCTQFGPAMPGQLFGPCQHYEVQCENPAYLGK